MPCLLHTDDDGPEEYFVTPFDPPHQVKCLCPGDCEGMLEFVGFNIDSSLAFLECSVCGDASVVRVARKHVIEPGKETDSEQP